MERTEYTSLHYDYFNKSPSYVKQILDILPDDIVSKDDRIIIPAIYNYILNNSAIAKIREIQYVSLSFIDKMSYVSDEEIMKQAEYMYKVFLKKMIYDSINRETFFNIMHENIKVFTDFYTEKEVLISTSSGIKHETGSYPR